MKTAYYIFIIAVLIASALSIKTAQGKVQPESHDHPERRPAHPLSPPHLASPATDIAASDDVNDSIVIQATNRISIPFGIAPILPLHGGGEKVFVNGHGGCAVGETVSVVVTVTQTTGASAVGQTEETCTGIQQYWSLTATATTATNLQPTDAEACGVAVTRLDGSATDSFEWCRDVVLTLHNHYLPIIRTEP